jgi:hypothetical protein
MFESTYVTSSNLVINFRPTLTSLHPAVAALINRQGWGEVAIVYEEGHIYEKVSTQLSIFRSIFLVYANLRVEFEEFVTNGEWILLIGVGYLVTQKAVCKRPIRKKKIFFYVHLKT